MEEKEKKRPEELSDYDWETLLEELPNNDWEIPKGRKSQLDFFIDTLFVSFIIFLIVSFSFAIIDISSNSSSTKTKDESGWIYVGSLDKSIAWLNSDGPLNFLFT